MKKYKINSQFVAENKTIDNGPNLNAIVFTNKGTNPVRINGETLSANESMSNNGLEGEIDTTTYKVVFDTSGGGTSLLYVRCKNYE